MDRYAIFVDAGYLFAAAGSLCFGTSARRDLNLDAEKATRFLREHCGNHCDQAHLRTYWYDAAPDAVPTSDQLQIGGQQGVKIRLGRLSKHGQKGVDSRIVRDLIVLSRNRAVSTVYLMSGDEDVREGVVEAQEFGVAVILLGIEPRPGQSNQAATLVREADDIITVSRSDCTRFLSRTDESIGRPHLTRSVAVDENASPTEFGEAYGRATRGDFDPEAISRILAGRPRIPQPIDIWLVKNAAARFGDPLSEDAKREVRAGFWRGIETGTTGGTQ